MKIAIIGAGPAGLACAIECEKLGIIPDVFERDNSIGWIWPSVAIQMNIFIKNMTDDIRPYLREKYGLDIKPLAVCKSMTLKSPNNKTTIKGKLGYFIARGKGDQTLEGQLIRGIQKAAIHFNRVADYKELSQKYDYVVVANGKDTVAKELDVWEDLGQVYIRGGVALGGFNPHHTTFYWNTDYAGPGYARITPFNDNQAIVGLYNIGGKELDADKYFTQFLEWEGLEHLEFMYKISPPVFSTGRVSKFQVDNILLAGRAAGLTERLMGAGSISAMISGIMAARAIIKGLNYDSLVKPLADHIENVSALRTPLNNMENKDLDRLISIIGTPGIKQVLYNSNINFMDVAGKIINKIHPQ